MTSTSPVPASFPYDDPAPPMLTLVPPLTPAELFELAQAGCQHGVSFEVACLTCWVIDDNCEPW